MDMHSMRTMTGRLRIQRAVALVGSLGTSVAVWASGPDLPVKLVKSGAAALQMTVIADPAQVAEVGGETVLALKGDVLVRSEIAQQPLSLRQGVTGAGETMRTPRIAFEQMVPGVYAYTVRIEAKMRGGGSKPFAISETSYLKVENGLVEVISAEQYTDAVESTVATTASDGSTVVERAGGGRDAGIVRKPGTARVPESENRSTLAPAYAPGTTPRHR
jgi:hypothetical protein